MKFVEKDVSRKSLQLLSFLFKWNPLSTSFEVFRRFDRLFERSKRDWSPRQIVTTGRQIVGGSVEKWKQFRDGDFLLVAFKSSESSDA